MAFAFDEHLAARFGLEEAVLLQHIVYWIRRNEAAGINQHDGRTWTYETVEHMTNYFPFWSQNQLRRVLTSLIEQGVILTGNYNKVPFDRTLWYTVADDKLLILPISTNVKIRSGGIAKSEVAESQNQNSASAEIRFAETGKPIPDTKQVIKQEKGTRRDAAADLFVKVGQEATGVPYQWQKADFVQLAKLRKAFALDSDGVPPGWEEAVGHYWGSPLAKYTLADLCCRYSIFRNSPLDRYNKPVNHAANRDPNDVLADKIRARMAARNGGTA